MCDPPSEGLSEQTYREAADKVFGTLLPSCPQLAAVVFQLRVNINAVTWSFVWSKQDRRAKFLGMNVAPHVIKAHEPGSDMLEPEKLIFG